MAAITNQDFRKFYQIPDKGRLIIVCVFGFRFVNTFPEKQKLTNILSFVQLPIGMPKSPLFEVAPLVELRAGCDCSRILSVILSLIHAFFSFLYNLSIHGFFKPALASGYVGQRGKPPLSIQNKQLLVNISLLSRKQTGKVGK